MECAGRGCRFERGREGWAAGGKIRVSRMDCPPGQVQTGEGRAGRGPSVARSQLSPVSLGRLGGRERGFGGWGPDIRWSRDCAGRRAWGDLMGGGRNEASVLETAHLAAWGGNSTRKGPGTGRIINYRTDPFTDPFTSHFKRSIYETDPFMTPLPFTL